MSVGDGAGITVVRSHLHRLPAAITRPTLGFPTMSLSPTHASATPRSRRRLVLLACLTTAAGHSAAAQTASQTVSFEVQAINQISVSGNPSALVVNAAVAGSAPTSVSTGATTWSVTTNETSRKVTASLNSAMPSGVTLSVALHAPGSATSTGSVALGTSAVDLVTGISKLNTSGLSITYTLAATAAAGVVAADSRTVTFTLVAGP